MATYEITTEMVLKPVIAEAREVAQALNEFADNLELIDAKYSGEVDGKADRETQKVADEWEEWDRAKEKFFKKHEERLKPCPFCGDAVRIQYESDANAFSVWHKGNKCKFIEPLWISGDEVKSLNKAYKTWNERVESEDREQKC